MNKNEYKKIFIRFLKEKDLYDGWLLQMKTYYWKKLINEFFEYTDPVYYINYSISDFWSSRRQEFSCLNKKLIGADFEWKLILSKLDDKYWNNVLTYIKSNYFEPSTVDSELYYRYKDLKDNN